MDDFDLKFPDDLLPWSDALPDDCRKKDRVQENESCAGKRIVCRKMNRVQEKE